MPSKAAELVELFVSVSVHEDGRYSVAQGRMAIDELIRRCLEMGAEDGITREQIEADVGDLYAYFRGIIDSKNVVAKARLEREEAADRATARAQREEERKK